MFRCGPDVTGPWGRDVGEVPDPRKDQHTTVNPQPKVSPPGEGKYVRLWTSVGPGSEPSDLAKVTVPSRPHLKSHHPRYERETSKIQIIQKQTFPLLLRSSNDIKLMS